EEELIEGAANCATRFGSRFEEAHAQLELVAGASEEFDAERFLAGKQTPVFFGSAINNFGVQEVLDALVAMAPHPKTREALERAVEPTEPKVTGVVFKVQANMDPAHRDRIAFVRVCSGKFERGMRLVVTRTGKPVKTSSVMTFLSQRR